MAQRPYSPQRPARSTKAPVRKTPVRKVTAPTRAEAPPAPRDPLPPVLTAAQTRFLRGQAHGLKAMLQVGGKGVTASVIAEVDLALEHHELVKIKVAAEDRDARDAMIDTLATGSQAALVQRIGHTVVLYRPSRDKRQIVLPRA